MLFTDFVSAVGGTPSVQFHTPECAQARIWVKLEGQNPSGSVKDRAALYNIKGAAARGVLVKGKTPWTCRAATWLAHSLTLAR
jgi:cysteine synthase